MFELGCGNGSVVSLLAQKCWSLTGVDPSSDGIAQANARYPEQKFENGSAYDNLAGCFGYCPVVTSLEVVEHVYAQRQCAASLFSLLEPGRTAIVSTPFNGY